MALIPYVFNERSLPFAGSDIFGNDVFRSIHQLIPKQLVKPWANLEHFDNMFKQMEQLTTLTNNMALNNVSKMSSDSDKFQVNVDVQHFAPDEITVKVGKGFVTVECKHEEKRDEHGYVARHFVRRYSLPRGCLPDTVETELSSDGVLTVTAPKVLPLPSPGERIVPIIQTGPVKKQTNAMIE